MKFLNRLLYQVHRWVGVVLAIFMFVWFVSGLAIMYAKPTAQSRGEQLAHAETLAPEVGWLSVGEAWERSAEQRKQAAALEKTRKPKAEAKPDAASKDKEVVASITDARLVRSAGEPVWLVEDSLGKHYALSAMDGSLRKTSKDQALKIAQHWAFAQGAGSSTVQYLASVDGTLILRNQDAYKPLHHIAYGDSSELLISERTGEVMHASTRTDRVLYYVGNWVHLFKPMELIGLGDYRRDAQLWSGFFATVASLTGLIIGWLRWRPGFRGGKTYSEGRTQPYREFWIVWHFWSGLIGGTVVLFWALSGYIVTNPWKLFTPANPTAKETASYWGGKQGAELPEALHTWQPALPISLATAVDGKDVVELGWRHLGKESVLLAYTRDGQRLPQTQDGTAAKFSEAELLAAVQRVNAKAKIQSQTLQTAYDSDYYPRHHQDLLDKPLPVLLVQLADEAGTRFYLDPLDGKLLTRPDNSSRVNRWLYSALHHWDFGWLYYRPVWDVWMLVWVAFGLVLSASSLVVGWRLLKKTFVPKKQAARTKQTATRPVAEVYQQRGLALPAENEG